MKRVVITGLGIVSCIGNDTETNQMVLDGFSALIDDPELAGSEIVKQAKLYLGAWTQSHQAPLSTTLLNSDSKTRQTLINRVLEENQRGPIAQDGDTQATYTGLTQMHKLLRDLLVQAPLERLVDLDGLDDSNDDSNTQVLNQVLTTFERERPGDFKQWRAQCKLVVDPERQSQTQARITMEALPQGGLSDQLVGISEAQRQVTI